MSFLMLLSLIGCAAIVLSSITIVVGLKKLGRLGDVDPGKGLNGPLVSIIIPACNEEKNIEQSILSLVAQDYDKLEIIVVNDRSTDNTARILALLKCRFSKLIVIDVNELPHGWMGKSHALATGAALATGDYLVFTDADVVMEKTTISRAVAHMTTNRLHHLTLLFKNMTRGWLLNSLILDAGMGLLFFSRPWMAKVRKSDCFMGIGAFNMVKTAVYYELGGHELIKMHPVEDMMLGKMIKQHGYYQDCLDAYGFVRVPWYDSVTAMVNGLEKNLYAVVHYRFYLLPVLLLAIIIPTVLPFWLLIWGNGYIQIMSLVAVGIRLATFFNMLVLQGFPKWYLPGCIISPYVSCYIFIKSAFFILKNGGLIWRGQHYSLTELKKTTPLFF